MCNLYRMEKAPDAIIALARELGHQLAFPEGLPNFQPRDVRITERAPILRRSEGLELVERRWSWPAPTGKPVFNFRGEDRRFPPAERCVILTDGFYEFTAPPEIPGAPKAKKKDRWLFTWPAHEWFGIAGIYRNDPKVGEAWTMLTCEPGPDVAPRLAPGWRQGPDRPGGADGGRAGGRISRAPARLDRARRKLFARGHRA